MSDRAAQNFGGQRRKGDAGPLHGNLKTRNLKSKNNW
jgi:hypothetical protein